MTRENVEFVSGVYESPDWLDALERTATDDYELDLSDVYPDTPVIRGRDEARQFMETGPWGRSMRIDAERVFDIGEERVLVFAQVSAVGQGSGAPIEQSVAHEHTIRDGQLARTKGYLDRDAALRANGLEP